MILRLTPTTTNEQKKKKKKKNHRSVHNNNNNYVPDAFIIQEDWSSHKTTNTHTHTSILRMRRG